MAMTKKKSNLVILGVASLFSASVIGAERQIEEVIVTAEKVEATVSDTSIAITAFTSDAIEEFGMQGADDMVNYIPATTRDDYDIRIRGVGRNFRSLGGDPGVATYYNGVYSPDFGIAASENALYDVQRIEVLRGPQGTLYGKNAIGGALNYITKSPTFDWTGDARVQLGDLNTREYYGVVSGPVIEDKLAIRALGIKRDRDGNQKGIDGSKDPNTTDDRNLSLSLIWNVSDDITVELRGNDRKSNRRIGSGVLLQEGNIQDRWRNTENFAYGLHQVAEGTGQFSFTADNGQVLWADYNRPGVDSAGESYMVNQAFDNAASLELLAGASPDDPKDRFIIRDDGTGKCEYPYTTRNCHHESFEHRASQNEVNWDINDDLSLKYIFGTNDFIYTFNIQGGFGDTEHTKPRTIVIADTQSKSHEIQLFWTPRDDLAITSGIYLFDEIRDQDFAVADTVKFVRGANYTQATIDGISTTLINSFDMSNSPDDVDANGDCIQCLGIHTPLGFFEEGTSGYGSWEGDARGDYYENKTTLRNRATAAFTQATWEINDEFALVFGVRYAEDERHAREQISGYAEVINGGFGSATTAFSAFNNGLAFPNATDWTSPTFFQPCQVGTKYGEELDAVGGYFDGAFIGFGFPAGECASTLEGFMISPGGVLALQGLGIFEEFDGDGAPINPFGAGVAVPVTPDLTDLAYVNLAMGNATWDRATGTLTPVCPLEEQHSCDTPLLLQGFPISFGSHIAGSDKWNDTNFRLNLDWTPTDEILMYFSVTTGYRAGGYSLGVLDAKIGESGSGLRPATYDSEAVTAYEIGYKGLHFDNSLQVAMALYTYDYENYQDQVNVFDDARQDTVNIVQTAPGARNSGFEIEALWLPTDRIMLGGNYSYTKTEYSESYSLAINYDQEHPRSLFGEASGITLPENGCAVLNPIFQTPGCTELVVTDDNGDTRTIDTQYQDMFIVNAKGQQLKGIPKNKYAVWGSYSWPVDYGHFSFFVSYSYTGEQYANGYEYELDKIPDRFRSDMSLTWNNLENTLRVRAFINNVTDESNVRSVGNSGEGSNWRQTGSYLAPRYWGIDIRYSFGGD